MAQNWKEIIERNDAIKGVNDALKSTLEAFLASDEFPESLMKATHASWGGSGYSVELFEDGRWRVLWSNEIGNKYISPGVILSLPTLDDSDLQEYLGDDRIDEEEEYFYLVYDRDESELKYEMRERFEQ